MKRLFSVFISLCLIASCFAGLTVTASAEAQEDNCIYDESGEKLLELSATADLTIVTATISNSGSYINSLQVNFKIPTGEVTYAINNGSPLPLTGTIDTDKTCNISVENEGMTVLMLGFDGGLDIFNATEVPCITISYGGKEAFVKIKPVAEYDSNKYPTIASAVDACAKYGTVKLIEDTSENVTISKDKSITIDLNDHILKAKESKSVIKNYGNLILVDSSTEKTKKRFTSDESTGLWSLYTGPSYPTGFYCMGGVITGGNIYSQTETNTGGGIYNSGTLLASDINIIGNYANAGGGIYNQQPVWDGQPVCELILNDVNIYGNCADLGAGIDNRNVAKIKGSDIRNNCATECGGGIFNGYQLTLRNDTAIRNNCSKEYPAAGVYAYHNDGSSVTLEGKVRIYDNFTNGELANLCLQEEKVTLNNLSSDSEILVTLLDGDDEVTSGKFAEGTVADAELFSSDRVEAQIQRNNSGDISFDFTGFCGAEGNEEDVKWSFNKQSGTLSISGEGAMANYEYPRNNSARPTWEALKDSIKKVVIDEGVTNVGEYAFYNYGNLTTVIFGEDVKKIKKCAFGSSGLTSVIIPKTVEKVYSNAFSGCKYLSTITVEDDFTKLLANAFEGTAYYKQSDNWDGEMLYIGKHLIALKNPSHLKETVLKNDTTTVFWDSEAIITTAYDKISGFSIANDNAYFKTDSGVLYSKDGKILYNCPAGKTGEFTIVNGTEEIYRNAFYSSAISKLTIPSSVKVIGDCAIGNSKSLKDLVIKAKVTEIPHSFALYCTALENVVIPNTIKKVNDSAFSNCTALKNIYYDASMELASQISIENGNKPFTLDKFRIMFDDCFDGIVNMSNYKTWEHEDYILDGWYDENGDKLVGDASYFKEYKAKWLTADSRVIITDTIKIEDETEDAEGDGWTYDAEKKTLTISSYLMYDTGSKPIVDLGSSDINLNIKYGYFKSSAEPVFENNGTGKIKITGGVYYFEPSDYLSQGYTFFKNEDGSYKVCLSSSGDEDSTYDNGGSPAPASTKKITIVNGDEESTQKVTVGQKIAKIKKPNAPEKKVFAGWYADEALTVPVSEEDKITDKITLFASFDWDPEYTINMFIGEKNAVKFGEDVENDVAPLIKNDRTMLPARFVSEGLGAKVDWDAESREVTITSKDGKTVIVLTIDSNKATINGEEAELDSPAFIENDRTYTPVRFIAEALGATVEWNADNQEVIIVK